MDDAAFWGFAGALVGAVIGALASIGATWLTLQHSASLETARAQSERIERAREFQRVTLIELQDEFNQALNTCMQIVADVFATDKGSQPKIGDFNGKLSQALMERIARLEVLVERVHDRTVRVEILTAMAAMTPFQNIFRKEDVKQRYDDLARAYQETRHSIGEHLRSHFEPIPPRQ